MPEVHGRASSPIDDHLLEMTGRKLPKICFIGTASGDAQEYHDKFVDAFKGRADLRILSLFNKAPEEYALPIPELERLLDHDIVYVGGGSTANLLAVWRLHGLPSVLAEAAAGGTILAGISAGSNCWFEGSSTDSFGPNAPLRDGLGLLPGSFCPHYLGEADRRDAFRDYVATGTLPEGYAADDGVAIVWRDGKPAEVVAERSEPVSFHVTRKGDTAVETPLEARLLV